MNEPKQVDYGDRLKGAIDLPPLDVEPYVGKKSAIIKADTYEGKHGPYVLMETDWVDEKQRIRASKIFSLYEHPETKDVGWPKDGKLALFLKKVGATNLKDVIGKVVTCQGETKKDGKIYLTFF